MPDNEEIKLATEQLKYAQVITSQATETLKLEQAKIAKKGEYWRSISAIIIAISAITTAWIGFITWIMRAKS